MGGFDSLTRGHPNGRNRRVAAVHSPRGRRTALHVRRDKAALFQRVQAPPGDPLQPEATGAGMEVTKCLKPPDSGHDFGDCASVQAATRVNAEQTSKRSMCRPTRKWNRGRLIRMGDFERGLRPSAAPG